MDYFGQNDEGDFDQYSIAGVDFGQNYGEDYGIMPTNLQGEPLMYGSDFDQLGIMPDGLSGMGNVVYQPEMGSTRYDYHNQLGHRSYHQQLGGKPSWTLGSSPSWTMGGMVDDARIWYNNLTPAMKAAAVGGVALVSLFALRQFGVIRTRLPLIG